MFVSRVSASPAGVFSHSDPVSTGKTPEAEPIKTGDSNVSTQTGAFEYSYPIVVPPGRGGATPSLALRYSSQGELYGSFAAGWTLQIPEIRFDPKQSNLAVVVGAEERRFVSSFSGNRVLVDLGNPSDPNYSGDSVDSDVERAYRAEVDNQYVRYERLKGSSGAWWRARTLDGNVYTFGDSGKMGLPPGAPVVRHGIARLTSMRDVHGNTVEYHWKPEYDGGYPVDFYLEKIVYSGHVSPTGSFSEPFAEVVFETEYDVCEGGVPPGAKLTFRSGDRQLAGARRVTAIETRILPPAEPGVRAVRRYEFSYDMRLLACAGDSSPMRMLVGVTEKARSPDDNRVSSGAWTTMPEVTFEYGPTSRALVDRTQDFPLLSGAPSTGQPRNLGAGNRQYGAPSINRRPTLDQMFVDFNGDGRIDVLSSSPSSCLVQVHYNKPGSGFSGPADTSFTLPTMAWSSSVDGPNKDLGEGCSLSGQFSRYFDPAMDGGLCDTPVGTYLSYRFVDIHSDGLPDLVVAAQYDKAFVNIDVPGLLPYRPRSCTDSGGACPDVLESCLHAAGSCDKQTGCQPAKALQDCATSAPQKLPCAQYMAPGSQSGGPSNGVFAPGSVTDPVAKELPPFDKPVTCVQSPHEVCGRYVWAIYRNVGGTIDTTQPTDVKLAPIPLDGNSGDSSFGPVTRGFFGQGHGLLDIDGDGYVDAVTARPDNLSLPNIMLAVWRGDGQGNFLSVPWQDDPYVWWTPEPYLSNSRQVANASLCSGDDFFANGNFGSLTDMNGDGLVDFLWPDPAGQDTGVFTYFSARVPGPGFDPHSGANGFLHPGPNYATPVKSNKKIVDYYPHAGRTCVDVEEWSSSTPPVVRTATSRADVRLLDFDADGRVDFLDAAHPTNGVVQLSRGDGTFVRKGEQNTLPVASSLLIKEVKALVPGGGMPWHVTSDLVDVTGDSLPDAVNTETGEVYTDNYGRSPDAIDETHQQWSRLDPRTGVCPAQRPHGRVQHERRQRSEQLLRRQVRQTERRPMPRCAESDRAGMQSRGHHRLSL